MGNQQSEIQFENQRLEQTISLAKEQLNKARQKNEHNREDIISLKKEMRENTVHSISGIGGSQGFEDLIELSQSSNPINDKLADYESVANKIEVLERLIKSPYFARIDFKFEDGRDFEKIYIGRSSLMKENMYEMVIHDWRSPIASVFYRFVIGKAFYEAPNGKIIGEVNLKRQYEISQGVLEYFFDADIQILDEFLRKMLSQNAAPKMKSIVETIQREQDVVIRDMENDLMMVQGVAGSGKTSIALHRAAYLMYKGLSDKLSANNIIIISPNPLFEQYISNVLPELGEENVVSLVFDEILVKVLKKSVIQTKNQFLEQIISNPHSTDRMKKSVEFKTSSVFISILERFIKDLPRRWVESKGISYEKKACAKYDIKKMKRRGLENFYGELFHDKVYFYHLCKDLELPDEIEEILAFTRENLCSHVLPYDDAAVLAFLNLRVYGGSEYNVIKQVVIDEAQDYYPLHYEIFHLLFSNAKYTVLGDINQTLGKQEDLSMYEQIGEILDKKKSILVTMDKSFRCTKEILNYSKRFALQKEEIKNFNRKGEKPELYAFADQPSLIDALVSEIEYCLNNDYKSIGLICKTQKNADSIYKHLKEEIDVCLAKEGNFDQQQVIILPVYMSKGLEYDAVLICDVSQENYNSEEDKRLLYIGCTRALHRLNLFCEGEASAFVLDDK